MEVVTEQSAHEVACGLLHVGDLNGASEIAEAKIQRLGDKSNTTELWRLRFIRTEAIDAHGDTEGALRYLESLPPPDPGDVESSVALRMYRGSYAGFLGRYESSHRLLGEAAALARGASLLKLEADVCLPWAFVFFRQKDYVSSDRLFRAALNLAEKVGGWRLRGHALWGIGKNLMIQEHYEEAMPWLQESLGIFENAGARLSIAMVWGELGVCHLGRGDDQKALELFQKAADVELKSGAMHNFQVSLASIGNVYLHRRDHFTAIS